MDVVYPPMIMSAYGAFALLNLKFDLAGGEHIPRKGGAVLASNHVSYLDFIFCGKAARPSDRLVRFMAKKSTFDHRVSGPLMRSMHHIPVDRAAGSQQARRRLADGADGENGQHRASPRGGSPVPAAKAGGGNQPPVRRRRGRCFT